MPNKTGAQTARAQLTRGWPASSTHHDAAYTGARASKYRSPLSLTQRAQTALSLATAFWQMQSTTQHGPTQKMTEHVMASISAAKIVLLGTTCPYLYATLKIKIQRAGNVAISRLSLQPGMLAGHVGTGF